MRLAENRSERSHAHGRRQAALPIRWARGAAARSPPWVSNARGRARSSRCSVNALASHPDSAQRRTRLRPSSSTGRPKHGVSISRTVRRPLTRGEDPARAAALRTRSGLDLDPQPPTAPTGAFLDTHDMEPIEPNEQITTRSVQWSGRGRAHAVLSGTVEAFRSISLVAIDPWEASTHLPATQVGPASRSHPPQVRRARKRSTLMPGEPKKPTRTR